MMTLENFTTKVGSVCVISSFANLFSNLNISISDNELFFYGDGLKLSYDWPETITSINEIKIHHYSSDIMGTFFKYLNEYLIVKRAPSSKSEFTDFFKNRINNNMPTIVVANTEYLTYHNIYKELNESRNHIITVYGYDDNLVYISDCFVPTLKTITTYQGHFNLDDFYNSMKISNFEYYDFDYEMVCNKINNITNDLKFSYFYKNLVAHVYGSKSYIKYLYDFSNKVSRFGSFFTQNEIAQNSNNLFFAIKYNGILASRQFVVSFIDSHFGEDYSNLSKSFKLLIGKWEFFNYMMLKNSIKGYDKSNYINAGKYLTELLNKEKEIFRKLINKIEKEKHVYILEPPT